MNLNPTGKYTGHKAAIYSLISLDENHFLSAGGDGYIVKWKISGDDYDGQAIASIDARIFSLCLIEDGIVVAGDMNGHVFWVDTWKNETLKNFPNHRKGVYSMIYHQGFVFTGGGSGLVTKWDARKMLPVESVQISSASIRTMIVANDDKLFIGSSDNSIYEMDINSMSVMKKFNEPHENSVFSLMKDGDFLFSGSRDAHINKYSLITGQLTDRIPAHWFTVNDLIKITDTSYMVSGSRDKRIRLWNVDNMEVISSIDVQNGGHINSVNKLLYIKDHQVLLSASDDRTISQFKWK